MGRMKKLRDVSIFLRMASRPVPRVTRMMAVAKEAGLDAKFVGAYRDRQLPSHDEWEGFSITRVGMPFPLLNGKRPWLYLRALASCNRGFFRQLRLERPRLVHASDIETFPASFLYRMTHRCRLIYNIHDNLAQRYSLPVMVKKLLNAIEGLAVLLSDGAVVPEEFRRTALPSWCRSMVVVIPNVPAENEQSPPPSLENTKIRIFYGGWLDRQRGFSALLKLSEEPDFDVRIAGEGSDEIVAEIERCKTVTYLGFLKSRDVIEETRRCHFVPVLYDPSREINRFAASNKLAEALAIGRPILMNRELEAAKAMQGLECVINTSYEDAGSTADRLRGMIGNPEIYRNACAEARRYYEEKYSWEKVKTASQRLLLGSRNI